jgi:hypothetical protein
LAMEDLERLRSIFYDETKQMMLYNKFGSSLKKKNSNYFLSLKTETILELFLRENFPDNCNSMFSEGIDWELVKRYQIQNIFWNENAASETSKFRKKCWDELLKIRTKLILKSKISQASFKTQALEKLKTEIGPDLTVSFINLALHSIDNKFVENFQSKNKVLNAGSLLRVFNFLRFPLFNFSDFKNQAADLIKSLKWRIISCKIVKKFVRRFYKPRVKKISRLKNILTEEENGNSVPNQMDRPVEVTNRFNNFKNNSTKPQVFICEEIDIVSFSLEKSMFDCFKRATILERTTTHLKNLVRSLELGTFCPYKAVDDVPEEGQYLCKKVQEECGL